jgi:hypothetical protein
MDNCRKERLLVESQIAEQVEKCVKFLKFAHKEYPKSLYKESRISLNVYPDSISVDFRIPAKIYPDRCPVKRPKNKEGAIFKINLPKNMVLNGGLTAKKHEIVLSRICAALEKKGYFPKREKIPSETKSFIE